MKTILHLKSVLYFIIFLSLMTSCKQSKSGAIPEPDPVVEETLSDSQPEDNNNVELIHIEGYFTTKRVKDTQILMLDKSSFDKYFHPASTMDNVPTIIDFDSQRVAGIILPESKNNVTISLDSSFLVENTLNIVYSVLQEQEARTFTIAPVKLFAFDSGLSVDSVAFHNGNSVVKLAVK